MPKENPQSHPRISLATTDAEITNCLPVLQQLRPHLTDASAFLAQVRRQQEQNYHLAFLQAHDKTVAVAGFHIKESLSWGKFLYVDDLIVDESERSKGHGDELLKWLIAFAKDSNCQELHLDSGVQCFDAHRQARAQRVLLNKPTERIARCPDPTSATK